MNYSLGNMLSRGGALNPYGLSLDLAFAADKTLTARRGPTPTFTRASTATFVGSNGLIQSAAINAPRFDHDPVTLASRGLLIEESRTNLALDSNSFNNWVQNSCTFVTSSTVTPQGSLDAWKIVEDSLFSVHFATRGFTPVTGTTYTASAWFKSAENGFVFFGLTGGFPTTFVSVNLSSGVVSTAIGNPIQAISVSYLNGWWRVSFSLTSTASIASNLDIRTSRDGNWANRTYTGNGINGVYCYGAQLEAGSFPTSYIPTTTTALTRSADVCSITGANFTSFYNQSEGTFFGDATPQAANQLVVVVGANTSASTASHFIYKSNNLINAAGKRWTAQTVSTGAQTAIATGTDVAISASKLSYAYKLNDFAFAYAGSIAGTDSSGTIPTPTAMRIGCRDDGLQINGHIARIQYFKKRLPNAKLQSLTTA